MALYEDFIGDNNERMEVYRRYVSTAAMSGLAIDSERSAAFQDDLKNIETWTLKQKIGNSGDPNKLREMIAHLGVLRAAGVLTGEAPTKESIQKLTDTEKA